MTPTQLITWATQTWQVTPSSYLTWSLLIVILGVFGGKNWPGFWHARLGLAILYHTWLRTDQVVTHNRFGGQAIFNSVITSSRSPLYECDFNMHKSNSTYFSDLDLSSAHLACRMFKAVTNPSLRPQKSPPHPLANQPIHWALGASSCHWLKEVKPYQQFEMHARILTWDHKWLYIITHFVPIQKKAGNQHSPRTVLASAISKVVFKQGRKTIPPADVFDVIGLLPVQQGSNVGPIDEFGRWGTEAVEEERQRGLQLAIHFAALDGLHLEFEQQRSTTWGKFGTFGKKSLQ